MGPRVSVILTCYNGIKWIGEAIESVLSQTFDNFELVIIDDGSIDESSNLISKYLDDERVRYFYQKNQGFSKAVNRGIK